MFCRDCKKHKTEDEFYLASNKAACKECVRARVRANRLDKIEHYRQFDRRRASLPHRVSARKEYMQTEAGKYAHRAASTRWANKHPERRKASHIVGNALRDGKLQRQPCIVCGAKAQAHHPDYSAPLDVVWLCDTHHKQTHALAKAA